MSRRVLPVIAGVSLALVAARGWAADASLPATEDVIVDIDAGAVDVQVVGWPKNEVELDSIIPGGWMARLEPSEGRISVRFEGRPGVPSAGRIELRMPRTGDLQVRSRTGDVTATGLSGEATVSAISGDVEVRGDPARATVATTSGKISVEGVTGRLDASTVSGAVVLARASGELRVESVSSRVTMNDMRLDLMRVATVSGDVAFEGVLRKGPHEIDAHSGNVTVRVPGTSPLRVRVSTFSGTIFDRLSDPEVTVRGQHRVTLGSGGPELRISTFSGDVELTKR